MRCIARRDFVAKPWKNGGGVTHEVVASPEGAGHDDFAWRVSLAELREAGAFSSWPGVSRSLMLLEGAPVRLDVDGKQVLLDRRGGLLCFSGSAPVFAWPDGAALDAGVMSRDRLCRQHSRVLQVSGSSVLVRSAPEAVLLLAEGESLVVESAETRVRLGRHDALLLGRDDAFELQLSASSPARVLFAEFAPAPV
ncbi:MAG: HutD family protein [Thauera sp.]|mgnify:CR=1 FL=1|jgi:environmental stress-induced protein Ves